MTTEPTEEKALRRQLAEARTEKHAAAAILQEKAARVASLEAALASLLSPVPLGAILAQHSSYCRDKQRRYRVTQLLLEGYHDTKVRIIGQPLTKDGREQRSGPKYIYGNYTIVALPAQEEEPTP